MSPAPLNTPGHAIIGALRLHPACPQAPGTPASWSLPFAAVLPQGTSVPPPLPPVPVYSKAYGSGRTWDTGPTSPGYTAGRPVDLARRKHAETVAPLGSPPGALVTPPDPRLCGTRDAPPATSLRLPRVSPPDHRPRPPVGDPRPRPRSLCLPAPLPPTPMHPCFSVPSHPCSLSSLSSLFPC